MSKTEVGTDNIYFEMESKKETEHGTYDETTDKSKAPATKRTSLETILLITRMITDRIGLHSVLLPLHKNYHIR